MTSKDCRCDIANALPPLNNQQERTVEQVRLALVELRAAGAQASSSAENPQTRG